MHIIRGAGGKENRRAADIGGLAPASCRDSSKNLRVSVLIFAQCRCVVGDEIAGRDCVHIDAFAAHSQARSRVIPASPLFDAV